MPQLIRGRWEAEANVTSVNYLNVIADFTSPVWRTVGTHEVFTVSGAVRLHLWIICSSKLIDAADLATIQLGHEGKTDAFIGATCAAGKSGVTIRKDDFWFDNTGSIAYSQTQFALLDWVIIDKDIGFEIAGEALTGGALEFNCVWEAMNINANVVEGAGGAL